MTDPTHSTRHPDTTRAIAYLPGLDIEIVQRMSPDGSAEHISINLPGVPSLAAFGRFLEAANPMAFWMQAAHIIWAPWLSAAKAALLPVAAGTDTLRADPPGPETLRAETPHVETPPNVETPPDVETPPAETPRAETPHTEPPRAETPRAAAPPADPKPVSAPRRGRGRTRSPA